MLPLVLTATLGPGDCPLTSSSPSTWMEPLRPSLQGNQVRPLTTNSPPSSTQGESPPSATETPDGEVCPFPVSSFLPHLDEIDPKGCNSSPEARKPGADGGPRFCLSLLPQWLDRAFLTFTGVLFPR